MKAQVIVAQLQSRKGQHVEIVWRREAKTFKGTTDIVEKRTRAFVRAGINYANLASVKEGIEAGERGEVQPLPTWQEWAQYPFILRHKGNGTEYVRLFPAVFDNLTKAIRVEWLKNGVVCDYATVEPLLLASEKPKADDEKPACFCVKADDVIEIAGE